MYGGFGGFGGYGGFGNGGRGGGDPNAGRARPGMGGAYRSIDRRRDPWDEAREANERRRNKIERMLKRRRRATMSQISGMGKAGMADINRNFEELGTSATQDMASRGLSGTTIAPTVQSSITRDKGAAIGGLRERLAGLKARYMSDLMGDEAGFQERIEEEYPQGYGY